MADIEKITSTKNARIKAVLELRERKTRDASGLIIVEGVREIARAREAHIKFREVYFCPDCIKSPDGKKVLDEMIKAQTAVLETTKEIFQKIAFGEREEGLLAVCERPKFGLTDIKVPSRPFFVVAEQVEKPGNLGAVLRSCDGAGADGLILCDGRVDGYNPNVIRSSLGTVFSVRVVEASNTDALAFLKEHHIKIYAALPGVKTVYTQADWKGPVAVVLGSEQEGLSDFWVKNADMTLSVPMRGRADSLNVSTTAAILMYEAVRQRSL